MPIPNVSNQAPTAFDGNVSGDEDTVHTGRLNAFDPVTAKFEGNLGLTIDGLWGLEFGNGGSAGSADTLYFAAGPNDEADGLFGMIEATGG